MEKDYKNKPIILTLIILLFLVAYSFVDEFYLGKLKVKKIDFFADIRKDTTLEYEKKLFELNKQITFNVSNQIEPAVDSFVVYKNNYSFVYLHNFWTALKNEEHTTKPIHIAYFGDSEIEGDLITGDLRLLLQERFGGKGVGYLPLASVDANFRNQVSFDFEEDNINVYVLNKNTKNYDYGISGMVFEPKKEFTVKYKQISKNANYEFIRLFYKIKDTNSNPYFYINKQEIEITAKDDQLSQYINKAPSSANTLEIKLMPNDMIFYGISLESLNGIYVDNFSLRGYTGITLNKIPLENLRRFDKFLNYRLVVLQYGMNVLSDNIKDYSFYKDNMKAVIEHFKKAFPKADILIISVGDKGKKVGDKYITDANIFNLIKAQKELAEETNASFINLFDLMGGVNTLVKWVNKGLAAPDYVHLSRGGSKVIAKKIFEIISNYEKSINNLVQN